jgi:GT2 family glycosyltransferase
MKLSIVIVAWNVREQLTDCLQSLDRCPPREACEVFVVDNASTDGTAEAVRRGFPGVTVLANEKNCGFAAANNQGFALAHGEYVLVLNPDTIVPPRALDILCAFMDRRPEVGACGPRLLNAAGTVQPSARRFPSFRASLHRHTVFRHLPVFRQQHHQWLMRDFRHDEERDVDQLMGAALFLRRAALDQVGGMDERFFMYYEEVDLCYRLRQAGWRIVFVPEATITHLGGESSRQAPVAARIMAIDSLLRYFRKHRGPVATGLFNCVFKPAVLAKWLGDLGASVLLYVASCMTFDTAKRRKAAAKVRDSLLLLAKHSGWLLFKA